ncbi:type III secretion HpaP family protein [Paraburkholderia bryophila]|uniref:type III secretion HpaP family protein n=1 Tax=Paraburkholderia bryophila TaxID=420952 RepID=UPI00234B6DF3|nr:type III secretion HpaP family protein [Paraburkholderia bryophila]WCM24386.1 type III secretion HpaP family protein [Paraburkholderia bryophila]
MSNEPIPLRPLRIIAPATAAADPPPSDQARSARFRSLMMAVSASAPLPPPSGQADAATDSARNDANADADADAAPAPAIPRESAVDSAPAAQHDDSHTLPLTDHAKQPTPNRRLAAHRSPSFSVRGNRPPAPRSGVSADSRLPSTDTPLDDNPSRLDRLTAHLTSLIDFTRAARDDQAVTIRLDPKILDDTTLHMAISRSRLSLRFQSPVSASRALIYAHADGLAARLEARIKRPTSIEVTA